MTAASLAKPRRPQAYHHGDLKNALLGAARELLERDGPATISFRAIARAVGVSQAAPYNHFPSKEHLLAALATLGFNELTDTQTAAARGNDSAASMDAIGRAYVRFARQNPQLYRLMFGGLIADWSQHEEAAAAKRRCFEPVQEVLATQLRARRQYTRATAEVAAIAAWSLVHGLAMLVIDGALQRNATADGIDKLVAQVVRWHIGRT